MARHSRGAPGAFHHAAGGPLRPAVAHCPRRGGRIAPCLGSGSPQVKRWLGLAALVALALVSAVVLGPAHVALADLTSSAIVRSLRVPRALLALLVGGSLGVAGASLQALVRNPLADPFLLGLSGCAGLGAVLAIALHVPGPSRSPRLPAPSARWPSSTGSASSAARSSIRACCSWPVSRSAPFPGRSRPPSSRSPKPPISATPSCGSGAGSRARRGTRSW